MDYLYYPGCFLKGIGKHHNYINKVVSKELGIHLAELKDWNCCGATCTTSVDIETTYRLNSVNFFRAQQSPHDIVTSCSICFNNLLQTKYVLEQNADLKEEYENIFGHKLDLSVKVNNLISILAQTKVLGELKKRKKSDISQLTVCVFYGCNLTRPTALLRQYNIDIKKDLETILKVLGVRVMDWDFDDYCCGNLRGFANPEQVISLTSTMLRSLEKSKVDALVVACPLCDYNLDTRQFQISTRLNRKIHIPIFYYAELLAGAMQLEQVENSFKRHITSVYPVLFKYWDLDGNPIQQTEGERV